MNILIDMLDNIHVEEEPKMDDKTEIREALASCTAKTLRNYAIGSFKMAAPTKWSKDEVVRVTGGPFADFTGKIEDVNVEKEKLKVLISIFGRDTPVELDFAQVERL